MSEQVLSPGGLARLRVGGSALECGMAEEDEVVPFFHMAGNYKKN